MANVTADPPQGKMVKINPQDKALKFSGSDVEQFLDDYELAAELDGASDYAKACQRDLEALVLTWQAKGGVSSVADYQEFRKTWGPLQSYLVAKKHIDSVLKAAVEEVMEGQITLTFEDSRSAVPVAPPFQASNEIMKKLSKDQKPTPATSAPVPAHSIDELIRMFQSLEQYLKRDLAQNPADRPAMTCFYCHRKRHGTAGCLELQKDRDDGLFEQQGSNFFLPNGALIPFDRSRPIRRVVASFNDSQPSSSSVSAPFRTGCGALQPWYSPAVPLPPSPRHISARKKHEASQPCKDPPAGNRLHPEEDL
ncbi:hypothetical protein PTTG_02058 [Puccinia triticina 1-1 BBBD Race 1]|uniref:Uncharacterized protein n=1 Tax=Puccinia triticina (isolate 1-1 / race 1 (BBBD)) TaxID=630390 RepID=A0A180GJM2_PUCT1|nr:hypothetical protein PTTG_02058 [Puccinia triticina 1-1 BBBD Race 1]